MTIVRKTPRRAPQTTRSGTSTHTSPEKTGDITPPSCLPPLAPPKQSRLQFDGDVPAPSSLRRFLRESVFYPCCRFDGTPIKYLARRFPRFVYADYSIDRGQLKENIRDEDLLGYRVKHSMNLSPETLLGASWGEIKRMHENTFSKVHFDWRDPFATYFLFQRLPSYSIEHGPEYIELIYICCEAIATYKLAYVTKNLTPKCLIYICPGISLGGNYGDYPAMLQQTLKAGSAGLPKYLLYDHIGKNASNGAYLKLIERYEPLQRWDYRPDGRMMGNVTLARIKKDKEDV